LDICAPLGGVVDEDRDTRARIQFGTIF